MCFVEQIIKYTKDNVAILLTKFASKYLISRFALVFSIKIEKYFHANMIYNAVHRSYKQLVTSNSSIYSWLLQYAHTPSNQLDGFILIISMAPT